MKNANRTLKGPLVAILAYDGLCTFEFGIAVEIFGLERPEMGAGWYRSVVCSEGGESVRALGGVDVQPHATLEAIAKADLVVLPGWRTDHPEPSCELSSALRMAARRGARLISICSGAFLLAAAGLLSDKTATTHWRHMPRFRELFPEVMLDPNVLYVDEGAVLTSAGSSAGIDLLLNIVRTDFGVDAANKVARRLVAPPHRNGGQQQFIEAPVPPPHYAGLGDVLLAIDAAPAKAWTIDMMAEAAGMSARTFSRRVHDATGTSPGNWLRDIRTKHARTLLETSAMPIAEVGMASGFGSPENFSRQFAKRTGLTPHRYRQQFAGAP